MNLPPLPPGFELDDEPVAAGGMPPLPPGFELEPEEAPAKFGGAAMNATAGVNEGIYGTLGLPVDLVRGGMNMAARGANAVAGTDIPEIPENSIGGSRWIGETMGAIAPELDPQNTEARTSNDRIARGVGQGVGGTVAPMGAVGGALRAGIVPAKAAPLVEALAGRSGSLGAATGDVVAGAAAGAGSATAQEFTPGKYDPLAAVLGGLGGGLAGGAAAGLPGLARVGKDAASDFLAPMTAAGRERMAGQRIAEAADDPSTIRQADPSPIVPGSNPTTFQQTGDMGLGALEREMQTKFPAEFQGRRAEQNTARRAAIDDIQADGAPEQVSRALRDQLKAIDDETSRGMTDAREWEKGANRSLGPGQRPEEAGDVMRDALQRRRDLAVQREQKLWTAVDPDGTLALPPQDARRVAQEIMADLPKSAKPPSAEEAAIYGVVGQYGEVMPFREVSALRSRVSQAIMDERSRSGKSPAWARLVQLRGAIESDLENAVSRKVLVEEQAVAAGQMREEDTLMSNFARQAEAWKAEKQQRAGEVSGQSFGTGGGNAGAVRSSVVRPASGGQGPVGGGFRDPAGDPRLPQDAGGAGGQPGRLTAADIRAKDAKDPFFVTSGDNQKFVPIAPGQPDLGAAPNLRGGGDLPIRVRRSDFTKHVASPVHYADAEILGYSDPWEMLTDISGSWTEMRRGEKGRILLVKPAPELNGVAAVELAQVDGSDYWRVVTAGRRREDQLGDRLAVRERTPDGRSDGDLPLVRRPTEVGQGQHFARAASEEEYRPFDTEAKGRLDKATEATRERANTFDNRQFGPILAKPADHSPYNMESAKVAARVFTPGNGGFERVQRFRDAAGSKNAMAAVEAYAVDSLRKAAIDRDTGQINPTRLESWRRSHSEALRAFPELDIKIRNAADAAQAVEAQAIARKAALDEAERGAFGRLIGTDSPEDVRNIVGGLFSRQDSVRQLQALKTRVGSDKEAMQGLRKAVADHVTQRMVSNTEAATSGRELLKADQFQTFVKTNREALRTIFSEKEVGVLEAVAADLQRANRSIASVKLPNQSNTAQDQRSILQSIMSAGLENWTTVAGGTAGAAIGGAPGALAGGGMAALFNALRLNGIASVDELVRDAMLNPERARFLLTKVPAKREEAESMFRALGRRYVKAATVGAAVQPKDEPQRGPMPLPPWMTPERQATPLQRALAERGAPR